MSKPTYKLSLLAFWIVLCLLGNSTVALASYYTLPIDVTIPGDISAYFDHDADVGEEKYYDGDDGTLHDYDNHHGIDTKQLCLSATSGMKTNYLGLYIKYAVIPFMVEKICLTLTTMS